MKISHNVTKEVVETKAIYCNKCGKSCLCLTVGNKNYFNGLSAEINGGFNSKFLTDCTTYKFDLCEECLVKLFAGFKVPPDIIDRLGPLEEDLFEDWRKQSWTNKLDDILTDQVNMQDLSIKDLLVFYYELHNEYSNLGLRGIEVLNKIKSVLDL